MSCRAKELFYNYLGSKYQMMRDDFIQEYLSYEIPIEIEKEWINELFFMYFNHLDINDEDALFKISQLVFIHGLIDKLDIICDFVDSNQMKITNNSGVLLFINNMLRIIDEHMKISDLRHVRNHFEELKKRIE